MDDLLEEFIAETRDTLEILSGQLVQWERSPDDSALLDSVFRFVHTVKGSCGFLDLPRLLRLSHGAEDILSCARDGSVMASPELVSAVLAVVDRIAALTNALENGQAVKDDDAALIDAMMAFAANEISNSNIIPPVQSIPAALIDNDQDDLGHKVKSRSVRISLNLVDQLMNGISDMVLARNDVCRQLRHVTTNTELDYSFTKLTASVADMRDAVGQMRMQDIDRLFSALPRVMRDIEHELGKKIDLQIEGSEVEVDREMVEALRDPLIHILRNSADHGIESVENRIASRKSPIGLIKISARQSGNQIVVEITDDGAGIDLDKIYAKALAAKLTTQAEWQKMPEAEKLNFIFKAGLSTAKSVSAISGRGVGMDLVRSNIQAVGGTIDLENFPGQGLKITVRLPLTLSIIAGLSVCAGDQNFAITRNSVLEIISSTNANVQIEDVGNAKIARVRNKRFPYAVLEDILGIAGRKTPDAPARTLIVIQPAIGRTFVLDVASVIDTEELVVKPASPIVMACGLYAGTSLPDTGMPILLLDASGLAAAIGADNQSHDDQYDDMPDSVADTGVEKRSALLFRNIRGRLQAIRFAAIERIENVDVAKISYAGDKWRVLTGEKLHDLYGIDEAPQSDSVKMLLLTDGTNQVYLAIDDVLDIFTIEGEILPGANPAQLEGIIMVSGEAVELVNTYQFYESVLHRGETSNAKALCFIKSDGNDHWEREILAPLLYASGYKVSFDDQDKTIADIILQKSMSEIEPEENDARTLCLREQVQQQGSVASIYRYDRLGLIAAIENRLTEAA